MYKSASLDSINLPTSAASVLTSTVNLAIQPSIFPKLDRRAAIIPTPNRPARLRKCDNIQSSTCEEKHIDLDNDNDKHNLPSAKQSTIELLNSEHNQSIHEKHSKDHEEVETSFDIFICENFIPFSGIQPLDQWLDQTEILFNRFKISRKLRFTAIPLLLNGEPKRKYIKNRHSITSFEDFYEFMLINYDVSSSVKNTSTDETTVHKAEIDKDITCDSKSNSDSKSHVATTTDFIQISQSCVSCSNKIDLNDTTKSNGDVSECTSSGDVSKLDKLSRDPVINDLRKAIVTDFIKNPKVFRGNKDDITKWLEEIDHLMHTAHIPIDNRLDLISYALRGDALQWYRNNRSTLTSWKVFILEIKRAFTSSFCEEVAFKTLESYAHSENQSVRNFYNEILKLCKKADDSMSESTKLKNLLNKVKPIIQLEVRKKKPKTTAEFLEYATEIEELLQLSSININSDLNYTRTSGSVPKSMTTSSSFLSNYSNKFNNSYGSTFQKNPRVNPVSYSYTPYTSEQKGFEKKQVSHPNSRFQQNTYDSTRNKSYDNNTSDCNKQKKTQQYKPILKPIPKVKSSALNAVCSSTFASHDDNSYSTLSSIECQICNQLGHDTSSCQSFQ